MSKNLKEYVVIICAAIVLTLLVNKFLFFKIVVPTPSMAPTIEPGDQLFATRIHNLSKMERGDMIVFYSKDSRYWSDKYIDGDDILGKAQITVWPLNRFNFAN